MNYRLVASLLLMAVLTGLSLWWQPPEAAPSAPSAAPAARQGAAPLGQLRIF